MLFELREGGGEGCNSLTHAYFCFFYKEDLLTYKNLQKICY